MKKIAVLFMIGLLFTSGCGMKEQANANVKGNELEQESMTAEEGEPEQESVTVEESAQEEENLSDEESNVAEEIVETEVELFAELPDEFYFSSGVGAWGTELYLQDDGTFYGEFHDSDMGSTGEGYPNGTQYICKFEGKFATPTQVSEYVYSTTIEYMNTDKEGEEYIEEGIRYIVSGPYGLDNAGEILIYLYNTPRAELEEGFLSWTAGTEMGPESLACYGIYNVNEETAFTGVKCELYDELCKLEGDYVNAAGDRVTIQLLSELNEYSYELGSVEWMPHDGEPERGSIVKNAKGGFTICLDESIIYNFEMTKYEIGKIEFSGADKWSEHFGTFVMQ